MFRSSSLHPLDVRHWPAFLEVGMNYPAASRGVASSVLARHSVLDTESSRASWIPASAGMTNSRQAAGNEPPLIQNRNARAACRRLCAPPPSTPVQPQHHGECIGWLSNGAASPYTMTRRWRKSFFRAARPPRRTARRACARRCTARRSCRQRPSPNAVHIRFDADVAFKQIPPTPLY